MGNTSDYSGYLLLSAPPTDGASFNAAGNGAPTAAAPNNIAWTGAGVTSGTAVDWTQDGNLYSGTYSGFTDEFNEPIVFYAGDYWLLTDSNATSFTARDTPSFTQTCYLPGTLIATPGGEVTVETLSVGDMVTTASGVARRVKWIGRRAYQDRFVAAHPELLPVRFRAGCLGNGLPRRDLLVSAKHAMFIDGVLIPAECLVNGLGIVRERSAKALAYFHVELDSHDVILAEGAPSETYLDDDNRAIFDNAPEFAALHPAATTAPQRQDYCAPRLEHGFRVEKVRRRLKGLADPGLPMAA